MIGQTIAHYKVTAKLGAGGMGEVYRATDTKLGRDVALKVLPEAFAADAQRMARFQREAQVLASLNHPNIAAIYGLEHQDKIQALAMELVEGSTLAERIKEGAIPIEQALPIAKQITEALEHAHEHGIIHRDLKPANIKLTTEGTVKVLDFGLAKALSDDPSGQDISNSPTLSMAATKAGIILGTAAYMSPEQAKGKPLDRRADIWAFGVVLYEMLTGRRGYTGETASDVFARILEREPDWTALPAAVPPTIRELLHRCLQKDPRQRLRDIGDARIEIDQALAQCASGASGALAVPAAGSRAAGMPWLATAGVALSAALVVGVAVWLARPDMTPRLSRLSIGLPASDPLATLHPSSLAFSPDGARLVYVAGHGQFTHLVMRELGEFDAKPLPGTEEAIMPFFSPDGEWIGFFSGQHLRKVPVRGGPVVTLCFTGAPWGGTWSADENIYFADRWVGESLRRLPAAGGKAETVAVPDPKKGERTYRWPQALPDGKSILLTVGTGTDFDDARIAVLDVQTRQLRVLLEGGSHPQYVPSGQLLFARGGNLLAVPFDWKNLRVTLPPVPVVEGVASNPALGDAQYSVAPDGSLAYVPGSNALASRRVVRIDHRGAVQPVTTSPGAYEDLDLSPDGQRLALTIEASSWNIWLYQLARGTLTRFTVEESNTDPLFTPDGTRIVFTSFRDGQYGLYWKPVDGSTPEERLVSSPNFFHPYSFSGDGQWLGYNEANPDTAGDLWILPMSGDRKPRPFLRTPFNEWFPAFSPDGRWLAYASDESGRTEVYVQPFPGPGEKVQLSVKGGRVPRWSADGREVFYREGDHLMAVRIGTGPKFSLGVPRQLFEVRLFESGHYYDPTADGQQFYAIQQDEKEGSTGQVRIILNFSEELSRRFTPGRK